MLEMVQHQSPPDKGEPLQEKAFPFVEQASVKSRIRSSHSRNLPAATRFRTAPACSQVGSRWV